MIDYIHITTDIVDTKNLLSKDFEIGIKNQGVTKSIEKYLLQNFNVSYSKNDTHITGSLHKWYRTITTNNWNNNHDQFTFTEVCTAIDTLCEILDTTPGNCHLSGLEFAFNLYTSFDPKQVISNSIICHRNIYDPKRDDKKSDGYIIQLKSSNWILKIYDKGKHQGQDRFIFRLEKKTRRQHSKIKTLDQLKEPSVWHMMKGELIKELDNLIFIDHPEEYPNFSNPLFWERLRRSSGIDRHKFKRVFDKIPKSLYKQELYPLIETTFENLMRHDMTYVSTSTMNLETTRFDTYYMSLCDTKDECKVTGIDISHQRKGSKFVSENTISDLPEGQFKKLLVEFLPNEKKSLDKKSQSYYIAHNIRNKFHNPKQPYRRLRAAGQLEITFNHQLF